MSSNQVIDKMPPQAIELEEAVLGALILSDQSFEEVEGTLKPEMFYKDKHQIIFSSLSDMHRKGIKIDLLTVTTYLKDTSKLEKVGGPLAVTELTSKVASAANLQHHVKIIIQKYLQRELIKTGANIQSMAYENKDIDDITELYNQFISDIENMAAGSNTGAEMENALKDAISEISADNEAIKAGKLIGISSGFKGLDDLTGGWRSGNLIVSGARPGQGKTSLALYFARIAAKEGKKVLFFSLEMLKADLLKILIAAETNISRTALRDGTLHNQNWDTISNVLPGLKELTVTWVDIPNISINRLTALAKWHSRRKGIDLIIIDYLQLIRSDGKPQYREQEVADISRKLKALSLSLHVPIIVNSQLNRLADNERPKLSHLRESGSIEQDADIVLLPWRPGYNGFDMPEEEGQIVVGKNRRGPRGKIEFKDLGQMLNFEEKENSNF